jgi:hypothetical protein
MQKHVGRDHVLTHHFEIARFDPEANVVLIRYQETPWLADVEKSVEMTLTDFVAALMEGRFEILRADSPALP